MLGGVRGGLEYMFIDKMLCNSMLTTSFLSTDFEGFPE